jgi:hypothetical protein
MLRELRSNVRGLRGCKQSVGAVNCSVQRARVKGVQAIGRAILSALNFSKVQEIPIYLEENVANT